MDEYHLKDGRKPYKTCGSGWFMIYPPGIC